VDANVALPVKMGTSWVWEALALGKLGFVEEAELKEFDWNAQHQTYGTPLIAILLGKLCKKGDSDSDSDSADEDNILIDFVTNNQAQKQARLDLLKLAIQRGADPNMKAPPSFLMHPPMVEDRRCRCTGVKDTDHHFQRLFSLFRGREMHRDVRAHGERSRLEGRVRIP